MPGGKRRLKALYTTGLQVGADGNFWNEVLSGSVVVTAPSFAANSAGSSDSVNAAVSNLTANHKLFVTPGSVSACVVLAGATPGAGSMSLQFNYVAGSGGAKASESEVDVYYLAVQHG